MAKFVWQDGTLVSKAKVKIGGTIYEVDPEEYSGSTPLSASNLNAMVDQTYQDLKDYVDKKQTYSTDEIVVGKWIDGKPIYRKVIDCGAMPNTGDKNVNHNIKNVSTFVKIYGFSVRNTDNASYPLPYTSTNSSQNMGIWATPILVGLRSGNDRSNCTAYVILEYTKTTDV